MAENDGKKKRKPNKGKVAFMFAFAVTVLSSRAASLAASATTVPNDDFDNQTTDSTQKDIGANPAYQKVGSNVFVATDRAHTAHNFTKELHDVRDYAVYGKTLNTFHVEGNVAADSVNVLDVFNSNVAQKGTNGNGVYTCYLGNVPDSTTIKLDIYGDTEYELVLGFDFTPDTYDNGHGLCFKVGGVEYRIECGGKTDKVKLRKATEADTYSNITNVLDNIAAKGQELISDKNFSKDEEGSALSDALLAISCGDVKPGQTMVININADDLTADTENLNSLLVNNNGVKVIINVVTDENTKSVDFGNVTHEDWLRSGANVTFNFGTYTGDITTNMNAGNFIAPYASFSNGGVLSGSVVANTVTMGSEIHQVTNADSDADDVEEKDEDDENKDVEENPEIPDDGDETEGDADTDSDADEGDADADTDTDTDSDADDDVDNNGANRVPGGEEETDPTPEPDEPGGEDDTDSDTGDVEDGDADSDDDKDPEVPPVVDNGGDGDGDEPDEPTPDPDPEPTPDPDPEPTPDPDPEPTPDPDPDPEPTPDPDPEPTPDPDPEPTPDPDPEPTPDPDPEPTPDPDPEPTPDPEPEPEPTPDPDPEPTPDPDPEPTPDPDRELTSPGDSIVIEDFEMIPDDDVPLGATPFEGNGVDIGGIEIPDDDVPLGANPYTGVVDHTGGLAMGAVGAAIALGLAAKKRGKKDDDK